MAANGTRVNEFGRVVHPADKQARIDEARAHYQTRAMRRTKGQSQNNDNYGSDGKRLHPHITAWIREIEAALSKA